MTAIPLGRELLHGSSFLPARSASSINACLFEIAPGGGYRVSPFVTQERLSPSLIPKTRLCGPIPRLIPGQLRPGFQRTAVSRHPALWSPDLPPAISRWPAAVWLASVVIVAQRCEKAISVNVTVLPRTVTPYDRTTKRRPHSGRCITYPWR